MICKLNSHQGRRVVPQHKQQVATEPMRRIQTARRLHDYIIRLHTIYAQNQTLRETFGALPGAIQDVNSLLSLANLNWTKTRIRNLTIPEGNE